jgi:hypothetical protein
MLHPTLKYIQSDGREELAVNGRVFRVVGGLHASQSLDPTAPFNLLPHQLDRGVSLRWIIRLSLELLAPAVSVANPNVKVLIVT